MSDRQKVLLWRRTRHKLQGKCPIGISSEDINLRDEITQAKFRALESVFWIKVSKPAIICQVD